MLGRVKTAVQITRAPFLTAVIIPTLVGVCVAWQEGTLHGLYLGLTFLGIICINAGLNMSNDYFDHLSGNDAANRDLTPFSGGSRVIQEGILSPRRVILVSSAFYLVGAAIGFYLVWMRGWTLLWIGALGVFVALFHNAPPVKLYYVAPGVGELAAGLGCGPLVVLGAYYVQTQRLSVEALWASLPVGFLVAAILYVNEFPDYLADRQVGKKTLVVVLGRERAVWGVVALLGATYLCLVLGVALRVLPYTALLGLLTLPMAYKVVRGVMRFHSDVPQLIPTNAAMIQLHLVAGLLLSVSFVLAKFL